MTATAPIRWDELVFAARYEGKLPVVIPTASAPLVGYFEPHPQYTVPFALALFSSERRSRHAAITAALMSSRADAGLDV